MKERTSRTAVGCRLFLVLCGALQVGMWSPSASADIPQKEGEAALSPPNIGESPSQHEEPAHEPPALPFSLIRLWEAPSACLSQDELLARTQREVQEIETQDRSLEGQIIAQEGKWHVTFVVYERGQRVGERSLSLDGGSCRDYDETLALVAALLLEHGPPPPAPTPDREESEVPSPAPPKEIDAAQATRDESPGKPLRENRHLFRFSAGLQLVGGWLPNTSVGPMIGWGVSPLSWLLLESRGSYLPPKSVQVLNGQATVKATGGMFEVRACALSKRWKQWGASGCIGGGWLAQRTRGDEAQDTDSVFMGSAEVSATGSLTWAISRRLILSLDAGASHPFRQGRYFFIVDGERTLVHQTSSFLGLGSVTASFEF